MYVDTYVHLPFVPTDMALLYHTEKAGTRGMILREQAKDVMSSKLKCYVTI